MNDYIHNKAPKDRELCRIIKRAINLDRKRQGFDWDDIANELGLNGGTLENKLKPSMSTNDIAITEFMHLLELSADYSPLEYIAGKFDMVLIPKKQAAANISDINILVDKANIENGDVFREIKNAISDGIIDEAEQKRILKEIDEAQKANAELKDRVLHVAINSID